MEKPEPPDPKRDYHKRPAVIAVGTFDGNGVKAVEVAVVGCPHCSWGSPIYVHRN